MTRTSQWIHGWLLLLPAFVLLALFTHYPAVATLWHSFFSTQKGSRPVVFVGADNYRQLIDDPIFWQSLSNNFWYAVWTIPVSIVIALLMAVWVNDRIAGRGFLRLAYFTPTVLPMRKPGRIRSTRLSKMSWAIVGERRPHASNSCCGPGRNSGRTSPRPVKTSHKAKSSRTTDALMRNSTPSRLSRRAASGLRRLDPSLIAKVLVIDARAAPVFGHLQPKQAA